jgi:hypothetical protein
LLVHLVAKYVPSSNNRTYRKSSAKPAEGLLANFREQFCEHMTSAPGSVILATASNNNNNPSIVAPAPADG